MLQNFKNQNIVIFVCKLFKAIEFHRMLYNHLPLKIAQLLRIHELYSEHAVIFFLFGFNVIQRSFTSLIQ